MTCPICDSPQPRRYAAWLWHFLRSSRPVGHDETDRLWTMTDQLKTFAGSVPEHDRRDLTGDA